MLATVPLARAQQAMPHQPVGTLQLAVQVCAACHGIDGNSPRGDIPSLAGQVDAYLEGQLHAFAAQGGQRVSGIMGAMAVNLSPGEMKRLANYFSHQVLRSTPSTDARLASRGQEIFFAGVPGSGVAACASCHGVRGEGLPDLFPRLAGQHARYVVMQLQYFRAGRRTSDPRAMMRELAARLSDRDIEAVAEYVASLR
ncbi:MAG: cytochrome c4 [Pseudomonadota bacterium]|nr:cytochrome c4 [Pseudomonadota bacterium]